MWPRGARRLEEGDGDSGNHSHLLSERSPSERANEIVWDGDNATRSQSQLPICLLGLHSCPVLVISPCSRAWETASGAIDTNLTGPRRSSSLYLWEYPLVPSTCPRFHEDQSGYRSPPSLPICAINGGDHRATILPSIVKLSALAME